MTLITGDQTIQNSPRSILLIQLGDIGDVVLSTPCIQALRENYPQAKIVVAVWDKAAELLEDCPWLDHVVAVTKQSRSIWAEIFFQRDFIRQLREFHFDLAIDLRTGTRGAIMAFLSGAGQRIGFYASDGRLWRNRLFTSLLHKEYRPEQHVVDYLLSLLETFGVTVAQRSPYLAVSENKFARIEALFPDLKIEPGPMLIAVQPFSLWQYKELEKEKYIALVHWLVGELGATVLVTGAASEQERAEEIVGNSGKKCYNLAGRTTIAMYAALLKKCRLFVGVDSAGLHIAAAVGTPTVGIFGPSSPVSWAPRGEAHLVVQKEFDCVPCRQKGCEGSEKSRCLDELSVSDLVRKIENFVGRK